MQASTILVDTSVWVDHFRHGSAHLVGLLAQDAVLMHPFVLLELAGGMVDLSLLASVRITPDARLWTLDKPLAEMAARLRVDWQPVA